MSTVLNDANEGKTLSIKKETIMYITSDNKTDDVPRFESPLFDIVSISKKCVPIGSSDNASLPKQRNIIYGTM